MADKPDKTDEPTTPTSESPVYDSLSNRPDDSEPVVATVDPEPEPQRTPPPLVEPEEIVVEESDRTEYIDEPAPAEPEHAAAAVPAHEPVREPEPTPVHDTRVIDDETAYRSQPQVVYVNAPQPPVAKSNRGFGVLIAVAATVVFQIVLAVVMAIVYSSLRGGMSLGFLGQTAFYVPALFFFVGLVVLVLLLNRAGWWTYVIGSIVVALFVYFGTIGALLLGSNVILQTPEVAAEQFRQGLVNPFTVAAALVAREIVIWAGAIVASRGRKVKVRNAEAKAAFEREQAQKRSY
jgi:hypothetical protein